MSANQRAEVQLSHPPSMYASSAGLASSSVTIFVNPFEVAKVRLQLQNTREFANSTVRYKGWSNELVCRCAYAPFSLQV